MIRNAIVAVILIACAAPAGAQDALLVNPAPATEDVPIQPSPRAVFTGSGWLWTDGLSARCDFTEGYYPRNERGIDGRPGGYFIWYHQCEGEAAPREAMRLSSNGNLLTPSGIDAGFCYELGLFGCKQGDISLSWNGILYFRGKEQIKRPTRLAIGSPSRGLLRLYESDLAQSTLEINVGTTKPTLSGCGSGAVFRTASNTGGGFTTTGASSCTLVFAPPQWSNRPSCIFQDVSTGAAVRQAVLSEAYVTITGYTPGATVMYHCDGGLTPP